MSKRNNAGNPHGLAEGDYVLLNEPDLPPNTVARIIKSTGLTATVNYFTQDGQKWSKWALAALEPAHDLQVLAFAAKHGLP